MRVSEQEIAEVERVLGLDRMQAYRHVESRKLALCEMTRKRAALTARALPMGAGRLDSPPAPSAPVAIGAAS